MTGEASSAPPHEASPARGYLSDRDPASAKRFDRIISLGRSVGRSTFIWLKRKLPRTRVLNAFILKAQFVRAHGRWPLRSTDS